MTRPFELDATDMITLNFIYQNTRDFGMSPTIKEVRQRIGMTTDSAVNYRLERLKNGGFITREAYKSRSLRLTDGGLSAIGKHESNPGDIGQSHLLVIDHAAGTARLFVGVLHTETPLDSLKHLDAIRQLNGLLTVEVSPSKAVTT